MKNKNSFRVIGESIVCVENLVSFFAPDLWCIPHEYQRFRGDMLQQFYMYITWKMATQHGLPLIQADESAI